MSQLSTGFAEAADGGEVLRGELRGEKTEHLEGYLREAPLLL